MVKKDPFMILAVGFSNYFRKYPIYEKKYGQENFNHTTNYKKYTIDEHLEEK